MASLLQDKAMVHERAGDAPGALACYDQVIAIRERLVNHEGRRELAGDLAGELLQQGPQALGDLRGFVALYDQAIAIFERLVNQDGRRELARDLAQGYNNKALRPPGPASTCAVPLPSTTRPSRFASDW